MLSSGEREGHDAPRRAVGRDAGANRRGGEAAIRFKDVEIVIEPNGAPRLVSTGAAQEALSGSRASVSLSHEEDMAVAIVITSPEIKPSPEINTPEVSG